MGGVQTEAGVLAAQAPVLRRARRGRLIGGVAAGIGRYLRVDPLIVRIAWIVLVLATGLEALLLYVAAVILIPEEREGEVTQRSPQNPENAVRVVLGAALISAGALLLVAEVLPVIVDWRLLAGVAMVVLGVMVLLRRPD